MICEHDHANIRSCIKALEPLYEVVPTTNMKECLMVYEDARPDLVLSAYLLKDGTGAQVARAMNDIALTKVILMSEEDIGVQVLEPLYADHCISNTILKPFSDDFLHELVTRTLAKCPICHGHVLGSTREVPCSYCKGKGSYTKAGYKFFLHHRCDCCNTIRCNICRKKCHH